MKLKHALLALLLAVPMIAVGQKTKATTITMPTSSPQNPLAGECTIYFNGTTLDCKKSNGTSGMPSGGGGTGLTGYQAVTTTIQDAVTAACAASPHNGVFIPPTYTGTDTFTNSCSANIVDGRSSSTLHGGDMALSDFGGDGSGGYYPDGTMSSGTQIIHINPAGGWATPGLRTGQSICMPGSGVAGATQCGTVTNYNAGTGNITVSFTASTTTGFRGVWWGTDNASKLQAMVSLCATASSSPYFGCTIKVGPGVYPMGTTITVPNLSGIQTGRVKILCSGGNDTTTFLWTGADNGDMFYGGATTLPLDIEGCGFQSSDYDAVTATNLNRGANMVHLQGGNYHRFVNNRFGAGHTGILMDTTWNNTIQFNKFYGPENCIWFKAGGVGPVNNTSVTFNEFGACDLYSLRNNSNGSGGSNGNFYYMNDFEGTTVHTIVDVDISETVGWFSGNRFETSGSLVGGWKAFIWRGQYSHVDLDFCGPATSITGPDNLISCSDVSGAISDTGGFNQYNIGIGAARSVNFAGAGAASATIRSGARGDVYADYPTVKILGPLATDNSLKNSSLQLNNVNGGNPWLTATAAEQSWNPASTAPGLTNGAVINRGSIIWNNDYAYGPAAPKARFAGWVSSVDSNTLTAGTWSGSFDMILTSSCALVDGTAAPVASTWKACDYVRNTAPTGTNPTLGWVNTSGGTPGTWIQNVLFNPATPPAIGSTTPNAGTFTTLQANSSLTSPGINTLGPTTVLTTPAGPLTIAGGPIVYYDASLSGNCTVNAATVSTWTDLSGHGWDLTNYTAGSVTTAPTCATNVVNGLNALSFNGTNMGLRNSGSISAVDTDQTWILVYKKTVATNGGYVSGSATSTNNIWMATNTTTRGNLNGMTATGTTADDGAFHIYEMDGNSGGVNSLNTRQDGTIVATGSSTNRHIQLVGLGVGADSGGGLPWNGQLAFLAIWTSTLSATDRANLDTYLQNRFGVTTSDFVKPFRLNNGSTDLATVDSNGKAVTKGLASGATTVSFSATPVFDAGTTNNFSLTMTANVTSSTLSNATNGQVLSFTLCQDGTGSRTFVWPTTVKNGQAPLATASKCSRQTFLYDGTNANALGPMVDDNGNAVAASVSVPGVNGGLTFTEGTGGALTAGSGVDLLYGDSTSHRLKMNNNNAGAVNVVGITTAGTANNCVKLAANGIDIVDNGSACGGGGSGYATVQSPPGTGLTARTILAVRDGLSSSDDVANTRTNLDLDIDQTIVYMQEDFCGGGGSTPNIGQYGWQLGGSGSGTYAPGNFSDSWPNICTFRLDSSGTASTYSVLGNPNIDFTALGNNAAWNAKFTFKLEQTTNTRAAVGFFLADGNTKNLSATDWFGLRYDTNAGSADASFKFVTCKASACTVHGTSLGAVNTNFHTIRLYSNTAGEIHAVLDAGTDVCFNSGGTGGCTTSANVTTSDLMPNFVCGNDTTAASSKCQVDAFKFKARGLSR